MGRGSARRAGTRSPVRCPRTAPSRRGRRPGSRSARSSGPVLRPRRLHRDVRGGGPGGRRPRARAVLPMARSRSWPTAASSRSSSATRSSGCSASPPRTRTTPARGPGRPSPICDGRGTARPSAARPFACGSGSTPARHSCASTSRPGSGERFMAGDAINTASRIQSVAPEMGVGVGEATWRGDRPTVEYVELPPAVAQGQDGTRPRVPRDGPRAALGTDPSRSHAGRLRRPSRGARRARATCSIERRPTVPVGFAVVVGEPGLGKSRLVAELLASCRRGPLLVTWRQGRCLPYGDGITFWALGEIVKAHAGILEATTRSSRSRSSTRSCPRATSAPGSGNDSCRSSGSRSGRRASRDEPSRHGAGSSTARGDSDRPCSSSRTSTGPTMPCWRSSADLATHPDAVPAARGRHGSTGAAGRRRRTAGHRRERAGSTSARCPMPRPVRLVEDLLGDARPGRAPRRRSSSERRGIRCSPRSSFDCSTTAACSTSRTAPCASGQAQRCPFPTRSTRCSRLVSMRCRAPGRPCSPTPRWSAMCSGRGRSPRWASAIASRCSRTSTRWRGWSSCATWSSPRWSARPSTAFWHVLGRDVAYAQLPRASRAARHVAAAAGSRRGRRPRRGRRGGPRPPLHDGPRACRGDWRRRAGRRRSGRRRLRLLRLSGDRALGLDTQTAVVAYQRAARDSRTRIERIAIRPARRRSASPCSTRDDTQRPPTPLRAAVDRLRERGDERRAAMTMLHLSDVAGLRWAAGDPSSWTRPSSLLERSGPSPDLVEALTHRVWERVRGRPEWRFPRDGRACGRDGRRAGHRRPAGVPGEARPARASSSATASGIDDLRAAIALATSAGLGRRPR